MLTIALTSIPPRFGTLPCVLRHLQAQTVPVRIVVSIPLTYRRFPDEVRLPDLPPGVILRRPEQDYGPATKLLGALEDSSASDILYCDDDWAYAPDWAETLVRARPNADTAVAASTFPLSRLKRDATPPFDRIAQGFGGVLVNRRMFGASVYVLPDAAFVADDIWLSGVLAAQEIAIAEAPDARAFCTPLDTDGPDLQDSTINGMSRAVANRACASAVTDRFGIWPPLTDPGAR